MLEGFWPLGSLLGGLGGLLDNIGSHIEASWAILSHIGGYLGLSEALLEASWAKKYPLTARDRPRPGPGEGVGGGVKFSSSPASRLAHSHPPSQHTSSTRDSACSAAVFGWTATGDQNRPRARDAGAQACQARLARQMRHVLHVRQVYRMLQPRQACHVRGARSVCQVRPRT